MNLVWFLAFAICCQAQRSTQDAVPSEDVGRENSTTSKQWKSLTLSNSWAAKAASAITPTVKTPMQTTVKSGTTPRLSTSTTRRSGQQVNQPSTTPGKSTTTVKRSAQLANPPSTTPGKSATTTKRSAQLVNQPTGTTPKFGTTKAGPTTQRSGQTTTKGKNLITNVAPVRVATTARTPTTTGKVGSQQSRTTTLARGVPQKLKEAPSTPRGTTTRPTTTTMMIRTTPTMLRSNGIIPYSAYSINGFAPYAYRAPVFGGGMLYSFPMYVDTSNGSTTTAPSTVASILTTMSNPTTSSNSTNVTVSLGPQGNETSTSTLSPTSTLAPTTSLTSTASGIPTTSVTPMTSLAPITTMATNLSNTTDPAEFEEVEEETPTTTSANYEDLYVDETSTLETMEVTTVKGSHESITNGTTSTHNPNLIRKRRKKTTPASFPTTTVSTDNGLMRVRLRRKKTTLAPSVEPTISS